jgi:hypothetical protein
MKQFSKPLIVRVKCVICESTDLIERIIQKNVSVYMGVTNANPDSDLVADQIWQSCQTCGCLQLKELLPQEILYQEGHSFEPVGSTWLNHHKAFKDFILENEHNNFCEIGGSHGYLATLILDEKPNAEYLMIEPDPRITNSRIKVLRGYFEEYSDQVSNYDAVIHSHVIEHIYDPKEFFIQMHKNFSSSTKMYISFPNIEQLIIKEGSNSLNFEHTYLITLENLKFLSEKCGFEVEKVLKFEDHSIFVKLGRVSPKSENAKELRSKSEKISLDFIEMWAKLNNFAKQVNGYISGRPEVPTFLFGAHIFSQILIHLGLRADEFLGILDNSSGKIGKRLYGTRLKVYSPSAIGNYNEVRVVLRAAQYQEEVKAQLLDINPKVIILE